MGKRNGRRSVAPDIDESLNPDLDLKRVIRERKVRLLNAILSGANNLTNMNTEAHLRVVKDDLCTKWSEYIAAFEEEEAILVAVADDSLDTITAEYMALHNQYVKARIHVQSLFDNLGARNAPQSPNPITANSTNHANQPSFKRPPLRISPFSGELYEWIEFKATCDMLLDANLKEVERLQYLKEALFGEARLLVRHILPGAGAFASAMKLLSDRYDNQRAIINAHLRQFYDIPYIETPTADSFRSILNTINGLTAAFKSYAIDTSSWNAIFIFHISQRFDKHTLSAWEEKLNGVRTIPDLRTLLNFLQVRITVLQTTETFGAATQTEKMSKTNKIAAATKFNNEPKRFGEKNHEKFKAFFTLKETYKCGLCAKNHLPSRCTDINRMSARDIQVKLKEHQLCENCFYPHPVIDCPFKPACKRCDEPHHSRLHPDGKQMFLTTAEMANEREALAITESRNDDDNDDVLSVMSQRHFYHVNEESGDDVLLTTAIVPALSKNKSVLLHTLIDDGATANLITINACNLLRLNVIPLNVPITGVGDSPVGRVVGKARLTIKSMHDENYTLPVKVIVVRSIGEIRGFAENAVQDWTHLHGLPLANPKYYNAGKFDLLLGNAAHADFILDKIIRGERHQPIARQSKLGWLISGNANVRKTGMAVYHTTSFENHVNESFDLGEQLKRFWEIEEVAFKKIPSPEEELAEEIFVKSIRRANNGKFIVDLPFKMNPGEHLGDSYPMAMRR